MPRLSPSALAKACPSPMPQSSTVWCASTSRSPAQRSFKSTVACFANRVSMWSKKGMPVLADDLPLPSRLRLTAMRVSLVFRTIFACRGFMAAIEADQAAEDKRNALRSGSAGLPGHLFSDLVNLLLDGVGVG